MVQLTLRLLIPLHLPLALHPAQNLQGLHSQRTMSHQEGPGQRKKCILEAMGILGMDKHLLDRNLMIINGEVQKKFTLCIKKLMKWTRSRQGELLNSK